MGFFEDCFEKRKLKEYMNKSSEEEYEIY